MSQNDDASSLAAFLLVTHEQALGILRFIKILGYKKKRKKQVKKK